MKIRCKTTQSIEKFNPDDLNPNTDLFGMIAVVFVFMAVLLSIQQHYVHSCGRIHTSCDMGAKFQIKADRLTRTNQIMAASVQLLQFWRCIEVRYEQLACRQNGACTLSTLVYFQ